MQFQLDHIVHVTEDVTAAVNDVQALGLSAFLGGEHANWGTRNGLVHFGLPYIEFLGIKHPEIAEKVTDNTLIMQLVAEKAEGFSRLALRVNDIDQAAKHFQNLGIRTIGPVPGSRKQPDGKLLEWAMLFIEDGGSDAFNLPFIIDWKLSDLERQHQLIDRGLITRHSMGDVTIADVVLPTFDLTPSIQQWEALFGAKIGESFIDEELQARCRRLTLGDHSFIFCEPLGDGPIKDHLNKRGPRPYGVHLANTGQNKTIQIHRGNYIFR